MTMHIIFILSSEAGADQPPLPGVYRNIIITITPRSGTLPHAIQRADSAGRPWAKTAFRSASGQRFAAAPRPGTTRCGTDAPHPDVNEREKIQEPIILCQNIGGSVTEMLDLGLSNFKKLEKETPSRSS